MKKEVKQTALARQKNYNKENSKLFVIAWKLVKGGPLPEKFLNQETCFYEPRKKGTTYMFGPNEESVRETFKQSYSLASRVFKILSLKEVK